MKSHKTLEHRGVVWAYSQKYGCYAPRPSALVFPHHTVWLPSLWHFEKKPSQREGWACNHLYPGRKLIHPTPQAAIDCWAHRYARAVKEQIDVCMKINDVLTLYGKWVEE